MHRIQPGDRPHQPGLVAAKVDLVQHQDGGRFRLFQRVQQLLFLFRKGLGAVLDEQHGVDVCHSVLHRFQHMTAQLGGGLVQTRRVHKDHLRFTDRLDAGDACACGLGLGADGCDLFADDGVEQGGLPGVGVSGEGHENRFCHASVSSGWLVKVASLEMPSSPRTSSSFSRILRSSSGLVSWS